MHGCVNIRSQRHCSHRTSTSWHYDNARNRRTDANLALGSCRTQRYFACSDKSPSTSSQITKNRQIRMTAHCLTFKHKSFRSEITLLCGIFSSTALSCTLRTAVSTFCSQLHASMRLKLFAETEESRTNSDVVEGEKRRRARTISISGWRHQAQARFSSVAVL